VRRTHRRWKRTVGIVTQDDVRALQQKVNDYFTELQAVIADAANKGDALPYHNETFSAQTWADLAGRVDTYTHEYPAILFTGGQYDRGRELIEELDKWRDYLASKREGQGPMANVPPPLPVPQSEVSVFGGIGTIVLAVLGILLLREVR
jgi:hypothetical protein